MFRNIALHKCFKLTLVNAISSNNLMTSTTHFLKPINLVYDSAPNYINASSTTAIFNINQSSVGNFTFANAETFLIGGLAFAFANSDALSLENPGFDFLGTNTSIFGEDGAYLGVANGNAAILGTYEVTGNGPFSFEFSANLSMESKEIKDSKSEYSHGVLATGFYVVDFTDIWDIEVIDYFELNSKLISSEGKGGIDSEWSKRIKLLSDLESENIGKKDGIDFVQADYFGSYTRGLKEGTKIAIIEVNKNFTTAFSDGLINALGGDVIYGTTSRDDLKTGDKGGKIYASHGDDKLTGGKRDDILEGGDGNDYLYGDKGNDKLHGGAGNDTIIGGQGNDVMVGGSGSDTFIFKRGDSLRKGEYDIVEDFNVNEDRIQLPDWPFRIGQISQTSEGALLTSLDDGKVLFKGLSTDALHGAIWWGDFKIAS